MHAITHSASLASLPPAIFVHLVLASAALLIGPVALSVRKGSRIHRAFGYAWVTVMLGAAVSALFIRDFRLPNIAGYTPIHLFVVVAIGGIARALWLVAQRRIEAHRKTMWGTYIGACVAAGVFTLLPGRYLGDLIWHHALGVI